jgi:hypothetical protein
MLVAGIPGVEYPLNSRCRDSTYEISCQACDWNCGVRGTSMERGANKYVKLRWSMQRTRARWAAVLHDRSIDERSVLAELLGLLGARSQTETQQ